MLNLSIIMSLFGILAGQGVDTQGVVIDISGLFITSTALALLIYFFRNPGPFTTKIQMEVIRVRDCEGRFRLVVIDTTDAWGWKLRLFYLNSNSVTRHYVRWNGKVWFAVMDASLHAPEYEWSRVVERFAFIFEQNLNNPLVPGFRRIYPLPFPTANGLWHDNLRETLGLQIFNGVDEILPERFNGDGFLGLYLWVFKWTLEIDGHIVSDA